MKDKEDIQLTEEELKAIKDYSGYQHTAINMIGNLDYKKLSEITKAGWKMPEKKEEVKLLIDKFINIYSVIYKKEKNNLPSEDELIKNANEKFMKKQLIPVNEKWKKKREKTRLEEKNEFIKYQLETKKFKSNNNLKENVQLPMNNFFY